MIVALLVVPAFVFAIPRAREDLPLEDDKAVNVFIWPLAGLYGQSLACLDPVHPVHPSMCCAPALRERAGQRGLGGGPPVARLLVKKVAVRLVMVFALDAPRAIAGGTFSAAIVHLTVSPAGHAVDPAGVVAPFAGRLRWPL